MKPKIWDLVEGEGPLVAAAVHSGHAVREEVATRLARSDEERLREEDPFTGLWTAIAPTRIIAQRSRFEVDLNRPREKAVYLGPDDAWGLDLWKEPPPDELVRRSLAGYDAFYEEARRVLEAKAKRYGRFVVFDLHTYNHRREGPEGPPAGWEENPEVNLGTGTMNRERWAPIVDRFVEVLSGVEFIGRHLDVRENVRFRGGHFPRWIHETFPRTGCALAIEVKKFFMDEWTGELDPVQADAVRGALQATVPAVLDALQEMEEVARW